MNFQAYWQRELRHCKTRPETHSCGPISAACCVAFAGTLAGLPAAAMAEQSNNTHTARAASSALISVLTHTRANARLHADSTSFLSIFDLGRAHAMLQPLFILRDRLMNRESVKLDEALYYLHEAGFCELLLSLLRRWPWAEMQQHSWAQKDLALLPKVLSSLFAILQFAARVRGSQTAAAYAELSTRYLQPRALACLGSCPVESHEQFLPATQPVPFPAVTLLPCVQLQALAGIGGDDRHCCQPGRVCAPSRACACGRGRCCAWQQPEVHPAGRPPRQMNLHHA